MNNIGLVIIECLQTYNENIYNLSEMARFLLERLLKILQCSKGYVWYCPSEEDPRFLTQIGISTSIKPPAIAEENIDENGFLLFPVRYRNRVCCMFGVGDFSQDIDILSLRAFLSPLIPITFGNIIGSLLLTEEVSNTHDLFLSSMSHELRNPLNGIVGMTRLMRQSHSLNSDQKECLRIISECSFQLLDIISDIMDFSKMGCGKLHLENESFDIRSCLEEVYDVVFLRAREKKITILLEQDPMTRVWFGDKKRIRQILINLLTNAIKFTPHGSVTIRVWIEFEIRPQPCLYFQVQDTGIGIPETYQPYLFQTFKQHQRDTEGVGLGLAICKKLCHLMKGDIYLKNTQENQGSTFEFYVPLYENVPESFSLSSPTSPTSRDARQGSTGSRRNIHTVFYQILIVEDNIYNYLVMKKYLEQLGYPESHIAHARHGLEAVQKVTTHFYDIIFMDLKMPCMDGFEATRQILAYFRSRVPSTPRERQIPIIVAMTACVTEADKIRCKKVGMKGFLGKPLNIEEIDVMLEVIARMKGD